MTEPGTDVMSPGKLERSIPDAAYEAGERAVTSYMAEVDALDVASDVLHSAVSLDRAGELRRIADELEVVAQEMREEDNRTIRSSGLGEGIRHLRRRADRYDGGVSRTADAVTALDGISGDDPEGAHSEADNILLALVPDEIRAAYQRLQQRCSWWATA